MEQTATVLPNGSGGLQFRGQIQANTQAIIGRERKRQLATASTSEFDFLEAAADDADDPDFLDAVSSH